MLLEKDTGEIENLLDGLKKEITAVVGEDADINFADSSVLINDFDLLKAEQNYNILLKGDIDIILSFGVTNNRVVARQKDFPKPTILFGSASREILDNFDDELASTNIKNFTAIITPQSYKNDLKTLNEIANSKNIGVLIEDGFLKNQPLRETFDDIEEELNIIVTLIPFNTLSDIIERIDGYDGIYLAGGFYLTNDEIKQLADVLIEKRIPSITATTIKDVENGIMASNHDQSELNQYFRRIALTVESAVLGEDLSKLPVKVDVDENLSINYITAEKIGIPLKYSLIATTNLIGDPNTKSSGKKYNLIEVMKEAIAENLELETFRQDVLLSDEDVRTAKSNYLPNLSVGAAGAYTDPEFAETAAGRNPELLANANVNLTQTVFSNEAGANITIQKALQKAQQENYNSEALNTVFQASSIYFQTLILKTNVSIRSQNLDLTKYNLKIAQENFEAGQAGKSDVLRFRSEMAQNTQELIEARNQLNQSFFELNQILNNPVDTPIDVEEAELSKGIFESYNYEQLGAFIDDPTLKKPFVDFLVQEAINNAPELKALDYNLEAALRSEKLYGAGRLLPTLALQGQYNYELGRSGTGTEFPVFIQEPPLGYYNVGLSLKLPIFDQNRQNINKQIATIQKDQINVFQDNVKLSVERNINDAVLELVNQIANIHLSKLAEETAKEALELTQTSYANGAVNIVQLLDAQINYLEAQLASSTANYNYLLRTMQLERYIGMFFLLETEEEKQEFINRFLEFSSNN
ncbi:TolC family protein [uncultured Algibacter sp.]|uniref:TolC family protein n=1 Tax=uncultured Algibacter sp. TaxID=298659 RepID=UPI002626E2CC|nr:TolC family protein [uncultured Algibacter sp.]